MDYILNLEIDDFIDLVDRTIKEELEEKLFFRWGFELPLMEKPISYEEYQKRAYQMIEKNIENNKVSKKKSNRKKTNEEIIKEIEEIKEKYQASEVGDK